MEGGYEEYRLLHFYERDFQKDAKYICGLTITILIVLGLASAFELVRVDIEEEQNQNQNQDQKVQLSIFTFYRCMYYFPISNSSDQTPPPNTYFATLGEDNCKLVAFGDRECRLEEIMMWTMAGTAALSFIFIACCLIGSLRTICSKKSTIGFLWFGTTALVITTIACATSIIVIVAADNALCSSGTNLAAASLPGFHFGIGFWLMIAAPVLSVGNAAFSYQTC